MMLSQKTHVLLSAFAKKFIFYVFALVTILVIIIPITSFYTSFYVNNDLTAPIVVEILTILFLIMGYFLINQEAKRRIVIFSAAIKELFVKYNKRDIPMVNWKLKWRKVLTHYK